MANKLWLIIKKKKRENKNEIQYNYNTKPKYNAEQNETIKLYLVNQIRSKKHYNCDLYIGVRE